MKDTLTDSTTKKRTDLQQQRLQRSLLGSRASKPERELQGVTSEERSSRSLLTLSQASMPRSAVVQTKLTVNEPDDIYEQEADQVAQAIMRMPNESHASVFGSSSFPSQTTTPLARAADSEPENDSESEEIDWMTDRVMRLPYHTTGQSVGESSLSSIQAKLIHRACLAREEETLAARKAAAEEPPTVTAPIENRIQGMNGGGNPLPETERNFFESRMGADLSGVRVHTDSSAAQTSRDLNARAFTVGNNIAFNSGEYQPGTSSGRHLLAHELTHTIQQGAVSLKRVQREVEDETQAPSLEEAVSQAQAEVSESEVASQEVEPIEGEEVDLGAMDEMASEGGEGGASVSVAEAAAPAPAENKASEPVAEMEGGAEATSLDALTSASVSVEGTPDLLAPESKEMPEKQETPAVAVDEMAKGETSVEESESSSPASHATPEATTAPESEKPPTSALPEQEKEALESATSEKAQEEGATSERAQEEGATSERAQEEGATKDEQPETEQTIKEEEVSSFETTALSKENGDSVRGDAESDSASAGDLTEEEPIQRSLGSVVIQRKVAPTSAEDDPAFQQVVAGVANVATQQKEHPPAEQKADEVAAAAQMPPEEQLGKAQDQQASKIAVEANTQEAKAAGGSAPGFDKAAFVSSVKGQIDALTPQDPKKMENIEGSGVFDNAKGVVDEKVQAGKEQAQGQVDDKTEEAPDTGSVPDKPVTALQPNDPGSLPAGIDASGAAPKAKDASEFETPLQSESQALDEQLAAANITEEQLEKSNEPEFQNSLTAKKEAQTAVQTDLPAYRSTEQGIILQSQAQAQTVQDGGLETLAGSRAQVYGGMDDLQSVGKQEDEAKRAEIGQAIDAIYQSTKSDVEGLLKEMEDKVQSAFNGGATTAKDKAVSYIQEKTEAFKRERYNQDAEWYDVGAHVSGGAKWLGDKLTSMPDEYYDFYRQGRDLYIQEMEVVLNDVADIVGSHLGRAKQRIEEGKQQITEYVSGQPEELRQLAGQLADNTLAKFDELEQNVDNKQQEMVDSLAQQYNQQLSALDSELEAMKEQDKGLLDKAKDAVTGTINTILELKAMLESALANAAAAIDLIIENPIQFLSNLLDAVKLGLGNFVANIGSHLKAGLIQWLTGAIAGAGLQMPAEFDLKGIFSLVMQILGLTYANIRTQVVKALGPMGEEIVGALEQTWEIFQLIASEGIAGLWQFIGDQIGDLKAMVMDQIQDMLITQVIQAGIQWLMGILGGPAGAFIKAVQAIISVVTWFMDNASRIASLINSIFGSLAAIAQGSIGAAASLIENSLAQTLPMVISFLADLLGLGGIADKVQAIFKKVQAPINKAIQWIVQKALAMGKKIMKMLGFGKQGEDGNQDKQTQEKEGLTAIDAEEQKYLKNGQITKEDAQQVAQTVENKHPIFQSITVVDGNKTWNYDYVIARQVKVGEKKHEIGGLELTGDEIMTITRQVAKRIYDDEQTNMGAEQIKDSERYTYELKKDGDKRKEPTLKTTVPAEGGAPARIRYLRERGKRPPFSREEITRGTTPDAVTVGAHQAFGTAPYVEGAGKYVDLAERLEGTGVSSVRMSAAIQTYIRTGQIPVKLQQHKDLIGQAAELIIGSEGTRNPATLVTAPMMLELTSSRKDPKKPAQENSSWQQQFERFPMAPEGAVKTADTVNLDLGFSDFQIKSDRKEYASPAKSEQAKEQEINLAVDWVKAKANSVTFKDRSELESFIEERVRRFYGMRATRTP